MAPHRTALFRIVCAAIVVFTAQSALADLPSELEAIVDQNMADYSVPGALVGVWRGNDPVIFLEKGFSDIPNSTPMDSLDAMRIASVTKTFTVTRLLQMQDEGWLDLDDPISNYVTIAHNGDATLRQLANMTSGIYDYLKDPAFVTEFITNPTRVWTDAELISISDQHLPVSAPGGLYNYSNSNTVLLGMVISQVATAELGTPRTAGEEIMDNIVTPLGLTGTSYPTTDAMPVPYAHGYVEIGPGPLDDFTTVNPSSASASGAMISRIEDLRKWAKELATGTTLSPEALAERLTMLTTAGGVGPEYDSYGLGIGSLNGWYGHTGDFIGYQHLVMYDPVNDQTVVIMINRTVDGINLPTDIFREMAPLLQIPEPSLLWLAALAMGLCGFRNLCKIRT